MLRSIGKLSREFVIQKYGTKVRRYKWHSAVSRGWPFPVLKYKYIFQAILSKSSRKLLWFEIAKMLIAVLENETYRVVHCCVRQVCVEGCAEITEKDCAAFMELHPDCVVSWKEHYKRVE